jgi:hypothetical protein
VKIIIISSLCNGAKKIKYRKEKSRYNDLLFIAVANTTKMIPKIYLPQKRCIQKENSGQTSSLP